jgi:hypothetical protein
MLLDCFSLHEQYLAIKALILFAKENPRHPNWAEKFPFVLSCLIGECVAAPISKKGHPMHHPFPIVYPPGLIFFLFDCFYFFRPRQQSANERYRTCGIFSHQESKLSLPVPAFIPTRSK